MTCGMHARCTISVLTAGMLLKLRLFLSNHTRREKFHSIRKRSE